MAQDEKKIRAFVAIECPTVWKEKLGAVQKELKAELKSNAFRWVDPKQFHLTLRFFGWVAPDQIEAIKIALDNAATEVAPFTLRYAGLGCFPGARSPRVLWAGFEDDSGELNRLYENVKKLTAQFGEPPEERPFKAHLTFARIKDIRSNETRRLEEVLKTHNAELPPEWPVSSVVLMQSQLSPHGASYNQLHSSQFSPAT